MLLLLLAVPPANARNVDAIAGKRVVFVGDSITQSGLYVSFIAYYLNRLHPDQDFDIISLGLASETLSGLSEEGHAGGRFPRPQLFERLARLLEKAEPEVVFACYGINDGIYLPLDEQRFAAFRAGVTRFIEQCREAGVGEIFLITPPIYDAPPEAEPPYDAVMAAYAAWLMSLDTPGVHVIDLHTAMRLARDARAEPFARDRVHPDQEGHLLMARVLLEGIGVTLPDEESAVVRADPLFEKVDRLRQERSTGWMRHIGYTRERTVAPQPLGDVETRAEALQAEIDKLRRSPGDAEASPQ